MSVWISRRAALCLGAAGAMRAHAARRVEEVRRFPAAEANQAVAVDARHFYAIGNHQIGKYEKDTGKRVGEWQCPPGKPLIHLNSGVVREGTLYCAHSNYPGLPMLSSIEMWDAATLKHKGSHSFGISVGSATWVDFARGRRYVTFAHYGNRAAEPGRDPRWTLLVEFDTEWRRLQAWVYPEEVISRLGEFSISGGVFVEEDSIFCTGHDHPELYALGFPGGGSTLALRDTFACPMKGQGIAWDWSRPATLYGIDRASREVIVTRVREG
jgi:hypothetical protein